MNFQDIHVHSSIFPQFFFSTSLHDLNIVHLWTFVHTCLLYYVSSFSLVEAINKYCCAISLNTKHQSNHIVRFEQKLFISYKQLANRMDNNTFWFTLLIKCYKTTYSNSPRVCTSGIYLQYLQRFNSDLDDFTGYVVQSIQYPPHQFHQCILRRMIVSEL